MTLRRFWAAADGDNNSSIVRIGFDPTANFDSVDAGDHGQGAAAGVVGAGRPRPDPGVQAGGEDVDQDLPVAGWLRNLELLVVRWLVERCHDGGVHHGHAGVPPETGRSDLVCATY